MTRALTQAFPSATNGVRSALLLLSVSSAPVALAATTVDLANYTDAAQLIPIEQDESGTESASCDVNGDGIDDLLIAAVRGSGDGAQRALCGEVAVVLGHRGAWSGANSIDAARATLLVGADPFDQAGREVACGDVNGDGTADVVIGAYNSKGPENLRNGAGEVHIVFGRPTFPPSVDLKTDADVTIYGPYVDALISGWQLSVGDIHGDGFSDVLIDNHFAPPTGEPGFNAGRALIVFGRAVWPATIDLAVGADLTIQGKSSEDYLSSSLMAKDLDRDGKGELLVGAYFADGPNDVRTHAGEVHVFRGRTVWPSLIDLTTQSADYMVYGADIEDRVSDSGTVSAGDIDGNGWPEIVIGVLFGDGRTNGGPETGEVRTVEPRTNLTGVVDLRTSTRHAVYGAGPGDFFGARPLVGDLNGDGIEDLVGSAGHADGVGDSRLLSGEIDVQFGKAGFPAITELSTTPPDVLVYGALSDDVLIARSLGDLNGDGLKDIIAVSSAQHATRLSTVWVLSPFDTDGDGVAQLSDNCPLIANPTQSDVDANGVGDICQLDYDGDLIPDSVDCRPGDVKAGRPGDIKLTSLTKTSSTVLVMTWTAFTTAESYDVSRGRLTQLRSNDFGTCQNLRDQNLTDTTFVEPINPPVGDGYYFLVRGRDLGCGGVGTWGASSAGVERINSNPAACP
jgi:hypothetical protein